MEGGGEGSGGWRRVEGGGEVSGGWRRGEREWMVEER